MSIMFLAWINNASEEAEYKLLHEQREVAGFIDGDEDDVAAVDVALIVSARFLSSL